MPFFTSEHIKVVGIPPLLLETPRPPKELFCLGNEAILSRPSVAVIGTRRPSPYGLRAAWAFGRGLSKAGFTVVSGLARGIDAAAHKGALAGEGRTVAVLGHGLDRVYPAENTRLAAGILKAGGAVISEYAPGVPPQKHHFPERNRIIAGLSLGALVVEAAVKSGSLLTARHALEANREVFVIPGAFDDDGFEGSHKLIQEGAKLVRDTADIVAELTGFFERPIDEPASTLRPVFESLGGSASLETLFSRSRLELSKLLEEIERAKIEGVVAEVGPQTFAWVGQA